MQKKNRKEKFLDCLTDGSTLYIGLNWKWITTALWLHSGVILQGVNEGKPSSVLNFFSEFCSSFYLNQGCPEKIKRQCLMVYLSCQGFGKCYIGRLMNAYKDLCGAPVPQRVCRHLSLTWMLLASMEDESLKINWTK